MLLDWVTTRLERADCPDWGGWRLTSQFGDRIRRFCPRTGEERWETNAWESIRSDSHQISLRAVSDAIWIQGSPARVMGSGDSVFGEDTGLNLFDATKAMIDFIARRKCLHAIPSARLWRVSRVDITQNYDIASLANVRVALAELRGTEGGRYRVSQQAGDTVYWSHHSRLRSGKAYAKGPHLRYIMKKRGYSGYQYSEQEITNSDRLIRLELTLGSQWWRERNDKKWYEMNEQDFEREHANYFSRMIGNGEIEMTSMEFVEKCIQVAPTKGQGKSAARTWAVIQAAGWQAARDTMPPSTWYRHLKILRDAGLSDTDISHGRIVGLRRVINMKPVSRWSELFAV